MKLQLLLLLLAPTSTAFRITSHSSASQSVLFNRWSLRPQLPSMKLSLESTASSSTSTSSAVAFTSGLDGGNEDDDNDFTYNGPNPILRKEKLSDSELIQFLREGHLFTSQLIEPKAITDFVAPAARAAYTNPDLALQAYRHKVRVCKKPTKDLNVDSLTLQECMAILSDVEAEDIPFMQLFNLWRQVPEIQAIALNPELGKFAADLLGVDAVRLYQDALFVKRTGDGPTMWHSDLNMAPFDSNDFVTCWIPLQKIPSQEVGGSSLVFASASHRDFALSYWSDPTAYDLSDRYATMQYDEWEVGDCTWHHGWTLHCAPGNTLPEARYALSLSFVADETALLNEEGHIRYPDDEDMQSYSEWINDIGWGGIAEHPYTPIVYRREEDEQQQQQQQQDEGMIDDL